MTNSNALELRFYYQHSFQSVFIEPKQINAEHTTPQKNVQIN